MSEDKTAIYYINRRIDELQAQLDRRFDSVEKLLTDHLNQCHRDMETDDKRIRWVENYVNKAVGALALFVFLLTLYITIFSARLS